MTMDDTKSLLRHYENEVKAATGDDIAGQVDGINLYCVEPEARTIVLVATVAVVYKLEYAGDICVRHVKYSQKNEEGN